MSNPRNALGRGLGALLPGAGTPPAMAPASRPPEPSHEPAAETPTGEIPIDAISLRHRLLTSNEKHSNRYGLYFLYQTRPGGFETIKTVSAPI